MTKNNRPPSTSNTTRLRIVILALFLFVLFSLLMIRFYKIQIVEGEKWTNKAEAQHRIVVEEPFVRGTFYSNVLLQDSHPEKPQAFVVDVPKYHLYIDPKAIPDKYKKEIADKLIDLIDLSEDKEESFKDQFTKQSRSRKLAMWLDPNTRDTIRNWWKQYIKGKKIASNAIFFFRDYQRSYPFGKMLGQVLHTIRDNKDETTKQGIPTGGLELYFNDYLKGHQGERWLLRSPRSTMETGEVVKPPINGANIYLTINHYLQAIAEEELAKGVQRVKGKGGFAVMMNPFTGEILALAQYPFFHPADYQKYYNDPELQENTKVKAITDAFEPGSTMKPITIAIALTANKERELLNEKPVFSPEEKIDTSDGHFRGRSRPLTDITPNNYMNMYLAIQQSSNIYMAKITQRVIETMGNDWYRDMLTDVFNFGKKTNIELPGETAGFVPTPGKTYPNGALEWSLATPQSLAIGYNLLVNSVQLVRAYSIFANGGFLVQPTLIKKIVQTNVDGKEEIIVDHTTKQQDFPRVLAPEVVDEVLTAMRYTTKKGGTAFRADIHGYTEAGKTGTSKKLVGGEYAKKYLGSFIGFAPLEKPYLVLYVGVDEPSTAFIPGEGYQYYGSKSAAPIFKEIARRSLEYLGITPDDPYGYPVGDPRRDVTKTKWYEETQMLEEKCKLWNNPP